MNVLIHKYTNKEFDFIKKNKFLDVQLYYTKRNVQMSRNIYCTHTNEYIYIYIYACSVF